MKTIKPILLAALMLVCTVTAMAQKANDTKCESHAKFIDKTANYIANELALDDKTRTKFISTYTRYKKELWAEGRCNGKRQRCSENEEQAAQNMKQRFERSQKILDIRNKYYKEFSKFMTQKQIEQMYNNEKKMMQRLQQRHNGKRRMMHKRPGAGKCPQKPMQE